MTICSRKGQPLIAGAAILCLASLAHGQSLGEVATKAQEQRKARDAAAKAYTQEDLDQAAASRQREAKPEPGPRVRPADRLTGAAARLDAACDAKDMKACFELARMYGHGEVTGWINDMLSAQAFRKAVAIDSAGALKTNQQECRGGNARGCFNVARMYRQGIGVTRDEATAAGLYSQACDKGDADSCEQLGMMHQFGRGVPKDEAKGFELCQRACSSDALRCLGLAGAYHMGHGIPRDAAKTASLNEKACRAGNPIACSNLAYFYETGQGVSADATRAAQYHQTACDAGQRTSCEALQKKAGVTGAQEQAARSAATPEDSDRDAERRRLTPALRSRYQAAVRKVEEAEAGVASAQRDLDDSGRVELDARYLNRERYRAGRRLESARSALATAQKQRDEIEDEARRAGLYPGDLR